MIPDGLFDDVMDWPVPPEAAAASADQAEEDPAGGAGRAGGPADSDSLPQPRFPGGGGVYLLTDAEDRPVLLASAGDLRRALAGRLGGGTEPEEPQTPETASVEPSAPTKDSSAGRRRVDLSSVVRRIRWRAAHSPFELAFEYWRIARVLLPDSYVENLGFGPCWFVHMDPDAAIPRLRIGRLLQAPPGVDLGPFATQSDATRFAGILQDAFDLCRYEHILQQAPHGRACAYFEMGRCPAPCDGSVSMSNYRQTIADALTFAAGRRDSWRSRTEARMHRAAAELAFERAAAIRRRLERAAAIDHPAFRHVRPIERFDYLVVQRGRGRTRVRPFFVRGGRIEPGPETRLKDLEPAAAGWIKRMREPLPPGPLDEPDQRARRSEQIWLVSHFLFRDRPGGLFLAVESFSSARKLLAAVQTCFARPPAGEERAERRMSPDAIPPTQQQGDGPQTAEGPT